MKEGPGTYLRGCPCGTPAGVSSFSLAARGLARFLPTLAQVDTCIVWAIVYSVKNLNGRAKSLLCVPLALAPMSFPS